jgi:DNA-binding MarR family transcriptional regulator
MDKLARKLHDAFDRANLAYRRSWNELIEPLGLQAGQPRLLYHLWKRDGRSLKEMIDLLSLKPATITKMTQRLEKKGFVERRPNADDMRSIRIFLTQKGNDVQPGVKKAWNQIGKRAYAGLSDEEKATLKRLIHQVSCNLKGNS